MVTPSPLRYPGGKTVLYPMVSDLIRQNGLERGHYAEPYAGGAGLALSLLFNNVVREIHINDYDVAVWSFWNAVLNQTNRLIKLIETTDVNIEEWHRQKEILGRKKTTSLKRGFAFFFLNRTNRSGIIQKAGVIGGLNQNGNYKIDCRFNKSALINKIKNISEYGHRIHLYNLDAIEFLDTVEPTLPKNSLTYIDPPYYNKGASLYTSFYNHADHYDVSLNVLKLKKPWIMTYDNTPEITDLYKSCHQVEFNLNYSVQTKRKGQEILVISKDLNAPISMLSKHLSLVA